MKAGHFSAKIPGQLSAEINTLTFTRFHLGHIDFRSDLSRNAVEAVVSRISDGCLKVPVEGVYPLEKVHEMYDRLLSRQVAGKLLLKVAE